MGENKRFQDLGYLHPKQGCYLLCSAACVVRPRLRVGVRVTLAASNPSPKP
jgi:hypothetical protein